METTNPTASPVTEPDLDIARILEDAALYLEHHGWCQGDMYEPVGGNLPHACALGAINMAVFHEPVTVFDAIGDDTGRGTLVRLAICHLADYLDDGVWRDFTDGPAEVVWKFNDHPDTIAAQVIRAFRAAAKRYRVLEDA